MIDTRKPKLQVTLLKNVGRTILSTGVPSSERFSGQAKSIDLTRFIGEAGMVQVRKSVRAPAGAFTITLTDMINEAAQDSIYGLIEPMDMVEIRMTGKGHEVNSSANFPVMMRGFVSRPYRTQGVDPAGKPIRSVTITGQDYGKVWQMYQVFNMPNLPTGESLISSFPFFQQFGQQLNTMRADQFTKFIVENVLNVYLEKMRVKTGGQVSPIMLLNEDVTITDGAVQAFDLGGWREGNMYGLLMQYCDVGPWNELFVEDRDDGPYVVCRPNPYFGADQSPINTVASSIDVVDIDSSSVINLQAYRSDDCVANYFWVDAPNYAINRPEIQRMAAFDGDRNTFWVDDYGNVDPGIYGRKKMWEQTQQANPAELSNGNGQPDGPERSSDNKSATEWITARRKSMIDQNKDNVVFEQGSLHLKGDHRIRGGRYVRLKRGGIQSFYYAVEAVHEFRPFGAYTTTVNFERGTNFIDRVKLNSPYYSEMKMVQT